jgi:hypothetical protein
MSGSYQFAGWKSVLAGIFLFGVFVGWTIPADGSVEIYFDPTGHTSFAVAAASGGNSALVAPGTVIGNFTVSGIATSAPSSLVDSYSFTITNNGPIKGTLDVLVGGDGSYLPSTPTTNVQMSIFGTSLAGTVNAVTMRSYTTPGGGAGKDAMKGTPLSAIQASISGLGAFSEGDLRSVYGASSFGIAAVTSVSIDPGETVQFFGNLRPIPEPATLWIWSCFAVIGLVGVVRARCR